tara:strand:+ start:132 stop:545 length:414 start_codon:yes stop_codon:yes gene_type:complete
MIYDLRTKHEQGKARAFLEKMIENRKVIILKDKPKKRTLPQNKYLHVIFGLFGSEVGLTLDEAKITLKRECGFMTYEKNGTKFLKGTSQCTKEEMQIFIQWIIEFACVHGIFIPTSEEYLENQTSIDKEIGKAQKYM